MLIVLLPLCLSLSPAGVGPATAASAPEAPSGGQASPGAATAPGLPRAASTGDSAGPDVVVAPEDGAGGDLDDDPAVAPRGEEESAELEEMRALEEAVIDVGSRRSSELRAAVRRLGLGNPLRQRLLDALDELDEAELDASAGPPDLPPITDLASFDVSAVKDRYDIPVEMQPLVAQYIQFFQGAGRVWFRKWMSRSTRYIPVMTPILESSGVPRDLVYLAMIESGFSAHAYSWAHASGPWQFIDGTGKLFGLKNNFWVDERRDPLKSTAAAARFLKTLKQDLGHWYLAWAGYNAGGGKVRRLMERKGTSDFWALIDGRGFANETKHYVPKLIACALVAKHPRAFGFSDEEFDYQPALEFDVVPVPAPTDLEVLARAAGTTAEELADLNPELKRWCTPPLPEGKAYPLRVPRGQGAVFAQNYPQIAPAERLAFKVHKVRRGDTISGIAAAYASAPEAILQMNRLRNPRSLRVSTELIVPVPSGRAAREGRPGAALERQVARAKRSGFAAVRPEEEIPAGTSTPVAQGPVRTEVVNGRTRLTYGVQSGDSLWAIGQRFNCSMDDLRQWNALPRRARRLQVGALLTIWPGEPSVAAPVRDVGGTLVAPRDPPASAASAPVQGARIHRMAAGETLWSIAQLYGLSVADLKRWNGIGDHRVLRPGQRLLLGAP